MKIRGFRKTKIKPLKVSTQECSKIHRSLPVLVKTQLIYGSGLDYFCRTRVGWRAVSESDGQILETGSVHESIRDKLPTSLPEN